MFRPREDCNRSLKGTLKSNKVSPLFFYQETMSRSTPNISGQALRPTSSQSPNIVARNPFRLLMPVSRSGLKGYVAVGMS